MKTYCSIINCKFINTFRQNSEKKNCIGNGVVNGIHSKEGNGNAQDSVLGLGYYKKGRLLQAHALQ